MVYIIVAHTFDSGDIVIDDNAYVHIHWLKKP